MGNLVSEECVKMVEEFEGFRSKPYYDAVGVKTLGYGFTGEEIQNLDSITQEEAETLLIDLLNTKYAPPIKNALNSNGVELNQNQFDALVSMSYNIGVGGVIGSKLFKNICTGVRDVDTITSNFLAWSYAGGVQYAGLVRRRQAEANMFFCSGNEADAGYSKDFIKSVQHDLQRVGCLGSGEGNATGNVTDQVTEDAIKQFRYIVDLPDSDIVDSRLVNALNAITQRPTIGLGWTENIYATKYIQWYLGLHKTGKWDAGMVDKVKAWQIDAKIWSASGADGVIRSVDWSKILK